VAQQHEQVFRRRREAADEVLTKQDVDGTIRMLMQIDERLERIERLLAEDDDEEEEEPDA
jgi:hypothetical protein